MLLCNEQLKQIIMNDEKKLGLEPAFPNNDFAEVIGMSKRFYAACMAMQGLITTGRYTEKGIYNPSIGKMSFEIADELLKAEQL